MSSPHDEPELLSAAQTLAAKVDALGSHLTVSRDQAIRAERQARRTKILAWCVCVLSVISLAGVVATGILLSQVRVAVRDNQDNAVTNCENANESRKANLVLWNFLIDASLAQDQTAESRQLLSGLQEFIGTLYAQRDCTDLSKKYPLPKPPSITDLTRN